MLAPADLAGAKARHDYSEMLQVRYPHPNGEAYDTWVSGEEAMSRLNTQARERLIKSFSAKDWEQAKKSAREEWEKGKRTAEQETRNRLGDLLEDQIGSNIFGDTLADNVRGVDSTIDRRDAEKQLWQSRLRDPEFRAMILQLAWISLDGSLPDEAPASDLDDWF